MRSATQPISSHEIARELGVDAATVEDMIAFWVRKGKLRDVNACTTCSTGSCGGCPFVVNLPKQYQLIMPE